MRHFTCEEWAVYLSNGTPEEERAAFEEHLYSCDICLDAYMAAVDQTLAVVTAVIDPGKPSAAKRPLKASPPAWLRRPVLLYASAAVITLLLMSSGVFDRISSQVGRFESQSFKRESETYSDKLMNRTVTMLDSIYPKEKGGSRIEP